MASYDHWSSLTYRSLKAAPMQQEATKLQHRNRKTGWKQQNLCFQQLKQKHITLKRQHSNAKLSLKQLKPQQWNREHLRLGWKILKLNMICCTNSWGHMHLTTFSKSIASHERESCQGWAKQFLQYKTRTLCDSEQWHLLNSQSIPTRKEQEITTAQRYWALSYNVKLILEFLVKQQALSTLPPQSITVFKGDPLEYRSFMMSFQHGVERVFMEQYTCGKPKDLVRSCLYMEPDEGYREAFLEEPFGNAYTIATAYINKALNWPSTTTDDSEALLTTALSANMQAIINKLPYDLSKKWYILETIKPSQGTISGMYVHPSRVKLPVNNFVNLVLLLPHCRWQQKVSLPMMWSAWLR